jgi:LysM repeat protein
MNGVRNLGRIAVLLVLVVALVGCNLSRRQPATRAPQVTATFVAPLTQPTLDPANPFGATAVPAVVNPNCATTPPNWVPYTIEAGDSLGLLAQQTNSSINDLVAGNCLENPDQIEIDQVIYLPTTPVIAP